MGEHDDEYHPENEQRKNKGADDQADPSFDAAISKLSAAANREEDRERCAKRRQRDAEGEDE